MAYGVGKSRSASDKVGPALSEGEAGLGTRQRSYQVSDATLQALAELRSAFDLTSDSAVIRRCIALARLLVREAKDGRIEIVQRDGTPLNILIGG